MKVLMVSFYNTEAYGVRSLHSCLIRDGYDAHMLFFKQEVHQYEEAMKKSLQGRINVVTEKEIALFFEEVERWQPHVVAFSLVSSHFRLFQLMASRLSSLGKIVVVGGWEASLNPERCIQYADYVCLGEGEDALCDLLNCLQGERNPQGVCNFWARGQEYVIKNPVRPLKQDLSDMPIPLFDRSFCDTIEFSRLIPGDPYFYNDRYGTFIGIGCPYQCTYCSNSYMADSVYPKEWSKIRFHSMARMQKELVQVKKVLTHVKTINFYDEVFSPSLPWMTEFFAWYGDMIGIPFCCTFFPGRCSDEMCTILAKSGLKGVWLGVQSGSERVRRDIFKRYYTNNQVLQQAGIFAKYHIPVRYDFIFDNPFETFDESLESVELMLQFPQPFSINQFSLKFFPRTKISQMALEAGIITEQDIADHLDSWQDNYTIAKEGRNQEGSFVNCLVSLLSLQAKEGRMDPLQIRSFIQHFRQSHSLDEVSHHLEKILI